MGITHWCTSCPRILFPTLSVILFLFLFIFCLLESQYGLYLPLMALGSITVSDYSCDNLIGLIWSTLMLIVAV